MRRTVFLVVSLLMLMLHTVYGAPLAPKVGAEAACLIVADNHRVLFDKQKDAIMYPASTTKIVTLLTALKRGNLDDVVTVSANAAATEGSSLDLVAGDRLTLREILNGMMLVSGNDAAVAVAEHLGKGSTAPFIKWMNEEADKAGATNTHFSNPNGLPDPYNHYTTAYDMALITASAYQYPTFVKIVSQPQYDVKFLNGQIRHVRNTNKLLGNYPGVNGVKTGYTDAAGDCLVAAAKRNGVQLIAVLYNDDNRWNDAKNLLDYGFQTLANEKSNGTAK